MTRPHVVCAIPARHASTRLPGKPLVKLLGKPMIEWVWRAVAEVEEIDETFVATDDERIRDAVLAFGGSAAMTPAECATGTDRIAAALKGRRADIVVNVQGDEPGMRPETLRRTLKALLDNPRADVATACVPIRTREEFEQPHVVKVVRGAGDMALYFSRAPIPSLARVRPDTLVDGDTVYGYKHLGLYIYRREALEAFVRLEQTTLEKREMLEQLRFLEVGASIVCPEVSFDSVGVDVEGDVARAEEMLRRLHGAG